MFWKRVWTGLAYALLICLAELIVGGLAWKAGLEFGWVLLFGLTIVIVLCAYFLWCRLGEILQFLKQRDKEDEHDR